MIQKLNWMDHIHLISAVMEVFLDLELAADISRGHHGCTRGFDIFRLALAEFMAHFRLGQVVCAGRSATDFGFFERLQLQSVDHSQQLSGLIANLLAMAKVAGIVVCGLHFDGILGLDWSQSHEKF